MRVLHTESSVNWGGQEYRILDQLLWLRAHGHDAELAARPGSAIAARAMAAGVTVHTLPYLGHYNPGLVLAARRLVRERAYDIVDCHGSRDGATHGFARDLAPVVRTRHLSSPLKAKLHRQLQWRWGCDRAIATAQCIKDELASKKYLAADRIDVVGEWAAPDFFATDRKEEHRRSVRDEFSVPADTAVIAVVGMLRGDKAQEILIAATAQLKQRSRSAVLLIVGADTDSQRGYETFLRAECTRHGVEDRVRFAGYRDDVARLTQAADALAISSIAVEAQSRTAPQAFAARTPVVASRIGGVAELVRPGETGRLVAPGDALAYADALEAVLDDATRTQKMVEAACALAERELTIDAKMAATLDSYRAAILSSGRIPA